METFLVGILSSWTAVLIGAGFLIWGPRRGLGNGPTKKFEQQP